MRGMALFVCIFAVLVVCQAYPSHQHQHVAGGSARSSTHVSHKHSLHPDRTVADLASVVARSHIPAGHRTEYLRNLEVIQKDLDIIHTTRDPEARKPLVSALKKRMNVVKHMQEELHQHTPEMPQVERSTEASYPSMPSLRTEQLFHAGSDLELLRGKVVASSLTQQQKVIFSDHLQTMEMLLSKLGNDSVSDSERRELMTALNDGMEAVQVMSKLLDHPTTASVASPSRSTSLDLEQDVGSDSSTSDVDYLESATELVIQLKETMGETLSASEEENISSLIKDLQLLHDSTDGTEDPDLIQAIKIRMPLVQEIANRGKDGSDSDISQSEKSNGSMAEAVEKAQVSEAKSNKEVGHNEGKKTEDQHEELELVGAGLDRIHDLQRAVQKADISVEKRQRFMNNLYGLEKDTKALQDDGLSEAQRSDLESAMKLRISLLKDMQSYLHTDQQ